MDFWGAGRFWKRDEMRQGDTKRCDSMPDDGEWLGLVAARLFVFLITFPGQS